MSFTCSPEQAAESSAASCSDIAASAPSRSTPIAGPSSRPVKPTAHSRSSRSSPTSEPSMLDPTADTLTSLLGASLARTSASPAAAPASRASDPDSGDTWRGSLAMFDPDSCSWKTAQSSLLGDSELSSVTWPDSGMTVGGRCYLRPSAAPLICGGESGYLDIWPTPNVDSATQRTKRYAQGGMPLSMAVRIPTPTAGDAKSSGSRNTATSKAHAGVSLTDFVRQDGGKGRMVPTPAARDYRSPNAKPYSERGGGSKGEQLPNFIGGLLNPTWVEWLMGWPEEWTALNHLETGKFREWLRQHSPRSLLSSDGAE